MKHVKVALVAAMGTDRAIGKGGQMPWRISSELQLFKRLTFGKAVIMGRKTWESLPGPLSDRLNIVITSKRNYVAPNATVVNDYLTALLLAADWAALRAQEEVMVIGGAQLYELALPGAQRLYLTHVKQTVEGADTFFPAFDESQWHLSGLRGFSTDEPAWDCYEYTRIGGCEGLPVNDRFLEENP